MRIRILFYVTPKKFKWKYRINWLISLWTRSKYSHCEIWTADSDEAFESCKKGLAWFGTCYTSTMRGDHNGTVKRDASEVLDHPEHWRYVEVEVSDDMYDTLVTWMNLEVDRNEGYAMWDLFKFLSPVHFNDKGRNICSEFCNNALFRICVLSGYGIISPKKLHKKLTKLGLETKSLKG